ncbi:MAG: response regulator transcription factor [Chloroflexi bacterium]|nr:response regulator transcription factor [Chloroflexota bacterium]
MKKILVVDDERKIIDLVRAYLEKAGFRVLAEGDGEAALATFRQEKPNLVILDLNLPRIDGLDVCRALRRDSDIPVIMLTARDEETDRLIGLELGADDYVTKPFSPRELVARVKAVLRRTASSSDGDDKIIVVEDLVINPARYEVRRRDSLVPLTPTEFKILHALAANPGRVFSRLQLLDRVQGDAFEGYERTIDAHIKNLRQKIEPDPQKASYIITVFGVGYRFRDERDG